LPRFGRQEVGIVWGKLDEFIFRFSWRRIGVSKSNDPLAIIVIPIEKHFFADLRFRDDGKQFLIQATTFLGTSPEPTGDEPLERFLGRHDVDPVVSFVHHYSSQRAMRTGRLQYAQVDHSKIFVVKPVCLDSIAGSSLLDLLQDEPIQSTSLPRQTATPSGNIALDKVFAISLYLNPSGALGG